MKRSSIKKRNRSGRMPCDVCEQPEYLVEHHIRGREIQNPNHPSNLANICPNCHYKIHKGDIILEQWLSSTSGKQLIFHLNGEKSITGYDANVHIF